jgi:hypothetical protein
MVFELLALLQDRGANALSLQAFIQWFGCYGARAMALM